MKEWAIVGAGPAGCHLAIRLIAGGQVKKNDIVLLDPVEPFALWKKRTANCGMTHLRSGSVHHVGVSTASLLRFGKKFSRGAADWRGKVNSPSLQLFNSHCAHLCKEYQLGQCWNRAKVSRVVRADDRYRLDFKGGSVEAERVVLALGPVWNRQLPPWLEPARSRVSYLLDPALGRPKKETSARVVVIGGGMTSVQAALSLCKKSTVTLLTRSPIRISEFDVVPGWMGPVGRSFRSKDPGDRRRLIFLKRRPGSVNQCIYNELQTRLGRGEIAHRQLHSPRCSVTEHCVRIQDQDWTVEADQVLLGTGFETRLHLLQQAIVQELRAPISACGFPLLKENLEWLPGLFVVGCHAELELGPAAGNLIGARLAAERILRAGPYSSTCSRALVMSPSTWSSQS